MYYSLSVDIVNTLEDLFDKNPTSSFCQNKLIFNDSVKKLPTSNAAKSGLMIRNINTRASYYSVTRHISFLPLS